MMQPNEELKPPPPPPPPPPRSLLPRPLAAGGGPRRPSSWRHPGGTVSEAEECELVEAGAAEGKRAEEKKRRQHRGENKYLVA